MPSNRALAERPRRRWVPHAPTTPTHAPGWKDRQWSSRVLHRVGELVGHSIAGLAAALLVAGWAVVGAFYGFPSWWQTTLYSVSGAVTLPMVFVIQHTQARQTAATQLKLDELIRVSNRASDALIAIEEAPAEHLQALTELTLAERDWS